MDLASLLEPLVAAPRRAALIFDVDGTLAPIAPRPDLARVPAETRAVLARLAERYLLVGCLSGRPGEEAARLVGVPGVRCVGNHGLELDPDAERLARELARFRDGLNGVWPVEDKRLSLSFHYREAADAAQARATLEGVAARARAAGLQTRFGRKVLDVRPPSAFDKGAAVQVLLRESGAALALYAGDDTTDLDAFRGLATAGLEHAVRIAVASDEVDPLLLAAADATVADPGELLAILERL